MMLIPPNTIHIILLIKYYYIYTSLLAGVDCVTGDSIALLLYSIIFSVIPNALLIRFCLVALLPSTAVLFDFLSFTSSQNDLFDPITDSYTSVASFNSCFALLNIIYRYTLE